MYHWANFWPLIRARCQGQSVGQSTGELIAYYFASARRFCRIFAIPKGNQDVAIAGDKNTVGSIYLVAVAGVSGQYFPVVYSLGAWQIWQWSDKALHTVGIKE